MGTSLSERSQNISRQTTGSLTLAFAEDWEYVLKLGYVHRYGSGVSPGRRIDAEEQWLELLAREYTGTPPPTVI